MVPARWLSDHAFLLPRFGDALDLACGRGRNALWLARQGLRGVALDRREDAVAAVRAAAAHQGLTLSASVCDLETGPSSFEPDAFDVIVVTHYLHRPLFPALLTALRPGGLLIYETFTRAQALRGKPTNPDFLLEPGELRRLVAPLEVVDDREGLYEEREVASVVARKR
jgi:SAM-dependent methyltransferase